MSSVEGTPLKSELSVGVAVIIPTLNAAKRLPRMLALIKTQTLKPQEVLVIDSNSSDGTVEVAKQFGAQVLPLGAGKFNHGATRQWALSQTKSEIVVYLTDDAFPADEFALENLCTVLVRTGDAGMAYGRQLPSPNATPFARHHREFNYPDKSFINRKENIPELGMKVFFASNSFAAYRRSVLLAVGGFPQDTIFGEDAHVAARMILAGYAVAYAGNAAVIHSHNYSLGQEFRRYFDAGVFHARNPWLKRDFGGPGSEGLRFVKSELLFLFRNRSARLVPHAILATAIKYSGFRVGKMERYLPIFLKRVIGFYRGYWI